MRSPALLAPIVLGALAIACSTSQSPSEPLPPVIAEAGAPGPAAAPTRAAFHRNPFGDVLQSDNLFVDGDFEITGRTDQAPWIVISNQAQGTLDYDTGGRCRSGVRCALIDTTDALVGNIASPSVDDIEINLYVQPTTQRCADASVIALDIGTGDGSGTLQSITTAPDADGWCHFAGKVTNMAYEEPAVYVTIADNAQSKTLHVDQASALPASETPVHGALPPLVPLSAAETARAKFIAAWLRAHRKFGRNAPRTDPR